MLLKQIGESSTVNNLAADAIRRQVTKKPLASGAGCFRLSLNS
jgi:hypothetical protein